MHVTLYHAGCAECMAQMSESSVDVIVCDPPYGLEFMGRAWDKLDGAPSDTNGFRRADNPKDVGRNSVFGRTSRTSPEYKTGWQSGGGFSKPGIGARQTAWPSFSATTAHGTANPTCAVCGGRLRGAKKCSCAQPHEHWKPIGKRRDPKNEGLPDTQTGSGMARHMEAMSMWHENWLQEAFRVLKPGGLIKAFSGTRTAHRLALALERVGFEMLPPEAWGYGSGFPKSLDVSKALDRFEGVDRPIIGSRTSAYGSETATGQHVSRRGGGAGMWVGSEAKSVPLRSTQPASESARQWEGWGTALKPAWEPVIVGRKP